MENLLLSTMPLKALQDVIATTVRKEIEQATQHLQPKEATEFLSKKQAAKFLGVSLVTLDKWTMNGKIIGYRVGKFVRYKQHELEQALQKIKTKH
ncbi:MAG: helix-turn-helix domain-containing protein [Sphingobacteriales bacterium]|nr:helix-turn-helix domain-containing protein [Sphingobacteriales bacterium]